MTSDYGAASQLEKIDMLDFAELVVLNKFDKRGAEDALRDVRKQWKRNRTAFKLPDEDVPVYPTIASQFNDPGITWMFANLCRLLRDKLHLPADKWTPHGRHTTLKEPRATVLIPGARVRYLAEIAEQGRGINSRIERQAEAAGRAQHFWEALKEIEDPKLPKQLATVRPPSDLTQSKDNRTLNLLRQRYQDAVQTPLSAEALQAAARTGHERLKAITDLHFNDTKCATKSSASTTTATRFSHQKSRKSRRPLTKDWGDLLRFLMRENLPGALSLHRRRVSRTAAPAKIPPACSPAKARPSAPTAASITCPKAVPPRACPPRSTPSRCTAKTRPRARTSTARSATPASTSPRWTT